MAGQQVFKKILSIQHFGGRPTMTKLIPTPAGAVRLCLRRSRSSRKLNLIETVHVGSLDFFNSHDRF